MRLAQAILANATVRIFRVVNSENEQEMEWDVQPADAPVLLDEYGFFIVKAKNILPDGTISDCYIDVSLPERISDRAYFGRAESLEARYHHEFEGEIICAVPIISFGVYELFYSKTRPDVGIEILKSRP